MDPFAQFRRLSDQMDRWFENFGLGRSERGEGFDLWAPETETFVRDNHFVLRMDIPGLSKDDLHVELTDDSLIVQGERQQTHDEERDGFYRTERSYGRFYREIPLPDGAEADSTQASYRDGVLEVTMKMAAREKPRSRRIDIGAGPADARERMGAPMAPAATPANERTVNVERNAAARTRSVAHDK